MNFRYFCVNILACKNTIYMSAQQVIEKLNLEALPGEGGFFRETFKSTNSIQKQCLPENYTHPHSLATCIYYLITPTSFSAFHKLPTQEIWHFYLGDVAEQIQLLPDGSSKIVRLGNDIFSEENPQIVVPANAWQATRLLEGGEYALFGTTMSPGFEFTDFIAGETQELIQAYPNAKNDILRFSSTDNP